MPDMPTALARPLHGSRHGALHIALLTHSVLPRGGVVHALELAEALTARGHAVTVFAPAEPGQAMFRRIACPVVLVPLAPVGGTLVEQVGQRIAGLVAGLPALLAEGACDLLHAHDSLSGNALAELRARGHVLPPWLRTVHHLDDFGHQPQLAAWQDRAWRSADALACVSDTWVRRMATEHGLQVQRLHNGVDLRRFRAGPVASDAAYLDELGLGTDDGGPLVLSVGGIESRKNSVRLLQAFARLRATDPAWGRARLVVVGGASLLDHSATHAAWRAALAASGLHEGPGEAVLCTGALPDAALPALMRRARLLAMPSLVEGFGLAALEALACATPVLVSDRAPFTEHLTGSPAVAWCDPLEVDSIAAGLRAAALLPRPPVVPAVCLAHGWDASAERHEAWYRAVLARPTTATATAHPASAPAALPRRALAQLSS